MANGVWALLGAILAIGAPAHACRAQDRAMHFSGTKSIDKPEVLEFDGVNFDDGSKIITNGFPVKIIVRGDLAVQGDAFIVSFDADEAPSLRLKSAASGSNGISYNPAETGSGRSGGDGGPGGSGANGRVGRDAGPIEIIVYGEATGGTLHIRNSGEDGSNGQDGGDGGSGGAGEQGQRARSAFIGCKAGPGSGGNGGNGGPGGSAGAGAYGGNGGDVVFQVKSKISLQMDFSSAPGGPGLNGRPGQGGRGGVAGLGGRGAAGCSGRETERRGIDGRSGAVGALAPKLYGNIPSAGRISIERIDK